MYQLCGTKDGKMGGFGERGKEGEESTKFSNS